MYTQRHLLISAALLATAVSAFAQASIDHNRALTGSINPGDAPGYPITLSQPGSYKLTGNLVVPAGTSGIEITAPHVTLDLNGFAILGPGSCAQSLPALGVTCNQPFNVAVAGIRATAADLAITVRNGAVQGVAGYGFFASGNDLVERVHISQNNLEGIRSTQSADQHMRIVDAYLQLNGGSGLWVGGGVVTGSRLVSNGANGISGTPRLTVLDTDVRRNNGIGLSGALVGRTQSSGNLIERSGVTSLGGNFDGAVY
ncbi:MAG: hypothetical protein CFE45_12390 [Burkholderiales bacterium PBB5]|nr:MAG: hypothetical protein CFE45_12390 [Burkholderiales bacterium PBB5]